MIQPTVGRVLNYWPGTSLRHDDFAYFDAAQPCVALVTYVHNERSVNVIVHDQNGKPFPEIGVVLIQEGDSLPPGEAYLEWMDYQKGQAAKSEQLQLELDRKAQKLDRLGRAVDDTPGGKEWREDRGLGPSPQGTMPPGKELGQMTPGAVPLVVDRSK